MSYRIRVLSVITCLALLVLSMGALRRGDNIIATDGDPVRVTATTNDTAFTLPGGERSLYLVLVNDGAENVYLAMGDRAVVTATDFYLKPNESLQVPIGIQTFHYRTSANSAVLRGIALK